MENNTSEKEDPFKHYGRISFEDFRKLYGEDYTDAINIKTWDVDRNLANLYSDIEEEIFTAKRNERASHQVIREEIFPRIQEHMPVPHAGLQSTTPEMIEKIHKGFLFNGAVTACGSVSVVYDSLPITITQMGICLVNYQGQHGSYSHQLFRRDIRFNYSPTLEETKELIERRRTDDKNKLNSLAMRSIKAYAERAILLEKSNAKWLLGYGFPAPYELMLGFWANHEEVKTKSIHLMTRLIIDHKRFVYIQESTMHPELWAFGNALNPFEYLVVGTLEEKMVQMVNSGNTRPEIKNDYEAFAREAGAQIAVGVYKVSNHSSPQIFYCHIDHIQTAALIAMGDSALQMHSGVPMLLDLAENLCKNAFGKNDFMASIDQAYTRAEVLSKLKK